MTHPREVIADFGRAKRRMGKAGEIVAIVAIAVVVAVALLSQSNPAVQAKAIVRESHKVISVEKVNPPRDSLCVILLGLDRNRRSAHLVTPTNEHYHLWKQLAVDDTVSFSLATHPVDEDANGLKYPCAYLEPILTNDANPAAGFSVGVE